MWLFTGWLTDFTGPIASCERDFGVPEPNLILWLDLLGFVAPRIVIDVRMNASYERASIGVQLKDRRLLV